MKIYLAFRSSGRQVKEILHDSPLLNRLLISVKDSLLLPLAAVFLGIMLLVSPIGEFPLNDDWIYAKTVQNLLKQGYYTGHPYLNATLIAQSYWGGLFCHLFSFSFTTLRFSTIFLSFLGAWAIARAGLTIGLSRKLALLCAIITITTPPMLGLSYSFMTDIPSIAMAAVAGVFFLKALRSDQNRYVLLGSLFSIVAFFVRQFGVVVSLAFLLITLISWWKQRVPFPWRRISFLCAPWVTAIIFYLYLRRTAISETPMLKSSKHLWMIVLEGIRYIPISLSYISLFLLPLIVGIIWSFFTSQKRERHYKPVRLIGLCLIFLFCFLLPKLLFLFSSVVLNKAPDWLNIYPYRMPLLPLGLILDFGLGHAQLPDPIPQPAVQLYEWWWIPTLIALLGAGILCLLGLDQLQQAMQKSHPNSLYEVQEQQALFLLIWGVVALALAYHPLRSIIVDRYFLQSIVPFSLFLALKLERFRTKSSLYLISCSASIALGLSICFLQDYMAWNQAAAVAQHRLMQVYNVSPEVIRGVDPWNGWYNSEKYMAVHGTRSWWDLNAGGLGPWVLGDQYWIASEQTIPNYKVLEKVPYFTWLGMQQREVIIFVKQE